ncbi:MAG: hypothetical protein ACYS6W_02405 [Planctomycetota bacterium]|jgi:hypothetical protein
MKTRFIIITVVLLTSFVCRAEDDSKPNKNHGPFAPDDWPKVVKLKRCDSLDINYSRRYFYQKRYYGFKDRPDARRLCLADREDSQWSWLYVEDSYGNVIAGPKVAYSHISSDVYSADLNRDGKEDYIFKRFTGGCGSIFPYSCHVVFALSDGDDYTVTATTGLWSGWNYFVDIKGDGQRQFIHTRFVNGGNVKGRDGKRHNYWVYNLLEFKGGKVVVNNDLAPHFPRWIWFTSKPNHQPTTQLTRLQKQFLWGNSENQIFRKRQAEPIELRIPGNERWLQGQILIIRYDPIQSKRDYKAPAYCSLPDTDPYVTVRGADKGLVRVVTDNNKQLKEYIVPKEKLRAVVDVYFGKVLVEDYHFVFTDDKIVLIYRSNSNAGIFSGCDIYELPYPRPGFEYKNDILAHDSPAKTLFYPILLLYQEYIAPTTDKQRY